MPRVTVYFKEGCWLCDHALEMLSGIRERYGLDIDAVDIDSDPELYELYRFDVPVIDFPDGGTLYGRVRKKDLIGVLDEHKKR